MSSNADDIVLTIDEYLESREELKAMEKRKDILLTNFEAAQDRVKWKRAALVLSLKLALGENF